MTRLALLLALAVPVALAQRGPSAPARDVPTERYHEGARAFVDGETERARAAVEAGLRAAPDDARLQALRDLLDQEDQDQQQGGQDRPQDGEGDDGEQDPTDDGSDGDAGDRDRPETEAPEAEQDQTRTQPQDPGESDAEESQGGRQTGDGAASEQDPAATPQGQMSRAQADRLLDAVGGEERLLLEELQRRPTRGRRSDKDW